MIYSDCGGMISEKSLLGGRQCELRFLLVTPSKV